MDRDLVRLLGPGTWSRIARAAGISRQHVGRVLRGDSGASPGVLRRIAQAAGVGVGDVREYIAEGTPEMGWPAILMHGGEVIACPGGNGTSRWDGLRRLVLELEPDPETPTPRSTLRVAVGDEAMRASQCLHSGKRSRANPLRGVEITTSVVGGVLAVWRRS